MKARCGALALLAVTTVSIAADDPAIEFAAFSKAQPGSWFGDIVLRRAR